MRCFNGKRQMNATINPGIQAHDRVPIVLIDDHDIWRDGVKSMLSDTEFFVVGEADSGADAPGVVAATHPRIAVLDIRMAGGDGFEALKEIKAQFPRVSVLM